MKLDIRFVGVKANQILVERIHEHLEELLGRQIKLIESLQLSIGEGPKSPEADCIVGEGIVTLTDGATIRVTTPRAKLMTLIDSCIDKLDEHFEEMETLEGIPASFHDAMIPTALTFQ